jgi:small subunit ribosomal protein S6
MILMRGYESLLVLDPDLDDQKVNETLKEISEYIEQNNGELKKFENLGKKQIKFKAKRDKQGFFYLAYLKAEPSLIKGFQNYLKLRSEVIRFYTTLNKETMKEEGIVNVGSED